MNFIKKIISKIFWRPLLPFLTKKIFPDKEVCKISYSQEGEDLVLKSLFEQVPPAARFFVDVGACHPKRLSNTYLFYKQGWRGVNIDAMPDIMKLFKETRPEDTNVEAAVGKARRYLSYFMFEEPGLNTFSEKLVSERKADRRCKFIGTKNIEVVPINDVLEAALPEGQKIGFMDVDIEGLDMEVLQSLDFSRFSPHYILVEDKIREDAGSLVASPIAQFLLKKGYRLVGKTYRTSIFRKRRAG